MQILYYLMMIAGWAALSGGFYLAGEKRGSGEWLGVLMLFAGLILAFLGVLLAFAPRFFS